MEPSTPEVPAFCSKVTSANMTPAPIKWRVVKVTRAAKTPTAKIHHQQAKHQLLLSYASLAPLLMRCEVPRLAAFSTVFTTISLPLFAKQRACYFFMLNE